MEYKDGQNNWKQIEADFIEWDNSTHSNASQRQILDWFKNRIEEQEEITPKPDVQEFYKDEQGSDGIIECIKKFDDTETLEKKGRYFEIVQRDLRKSNEQSSAKGAEETLKKYIYHTYPTGHILSKYYFYEREIVLQAMEQYRREGKPTITNSDIEAWAKSKSCIAYGFKANSGIFDGNRERDLIEGAKAALNNEIRHLK